MALAQAQYSKVIKSSIMKTIKKHALLISAPWMRSNMPCVAIAALAAYAKRLGYSVDTLHAYLRFADILAELSNDNINASEAEAIAASLCFPEKKQGILKNIKRRYSGVESFRNKIHASLQTLFNEVNWQEYRIIGFSVVHGRLYFSLLIAKWLKELFGRDIHIVFGGLRTYGDLGDKIIKEFEQVDSIVSGEGELPLIQLINAVCKGSHFDLMKVDGIRMRSGKKIISNKTVQIESMDDMPVPYYDEYVRILSSGIDMAVSDAYLTVEASRGCYNRCAFCSDVLSCRGYRIKSPANVVDEIHYLRKRFGQLHFSTADVAAPPHLKWWQEFGRLMRKRDPKKSITLKVDARSDSTGHYFKALASSGVHHVQIGTETLSQGLLDDMNKNTSVINNMYSLKASEEAGLIVYTNLMLKFPTEDARKLKETADNLDFVMGFRPLLGPFDFMLEHGTTVYNKPKDFGVTSIIPKDTACGYPAIPSFLLKKYGSFTYDFRRKKYPVYRHILAKYYTWVGKYLANQKKGIRLLIYYDCGDHGFVEDRRFRYKLIKLCESKNRLMRACQGICTFDDIVSGHPWVDSDQLTKDLDELIKLKIIFEQDGRYLAVPLNMKYESKLYRETEETLGAFHNYYRAVSRCK